MDNVTAWGTMNATTMNTRASFGISAKRARERSSTRTVMYMKACFTIIFQMAMEYGPMLAARDILVHRKTDALECFIHDLREGGMRMHHHT